MGMFDPVSVFIHSFFFVSHHLSEDLHLPEPYYNMDIVVRASVFCRGIMHACLYSRVVPTSVLSLLM